ncbi:hypothetical protein [Streptomyces sp. 196(2019)]|uniref:hypothetical protein n=1 Tax=Streptomyces sp. 196(2019) TaxID=2683820 RepID=UPI0013E9AC71|nr:hypothetical protein [Streptomyces sp. 196(2019)]NGO85127.1 hypothetical protein [Streptomyces sp. 196(2019)]
MSSASLAAVGSIEVELPTAFHPGWNRLPGVRVDGRTLAIESAEYFFRLESHSWLVVEWEKVRDGLLYTHETTSSAVEQLALDFIREHAEPTSDPALVLRTAYEVYGHLFRGDLLASADLPGVTAGHLRMLHEAATLMALNKVELDGHISNIGPCWFFPAATSVVFGLDDDEGRMLDELYHGAWFNEHRRIESIKAHAALGGRLVHGCQAKADQTGGVVAPYGAAMAAFRRDLETFKKEWIARVYAYRVEPAR